jgi:thiamine-monophosphate kinase
VPDATARGIGEFALIDRVVARLGSSPAVVVGPGDDAAVVAAPDARVVATTDVLVEEVHFRRAWSSAYDVGRKAAAANLADVAAMGARGTALLVGLSAPGDLPVEWALGLADGLRDEAALVGAAVVGGDMVTGDRVVVAVTALGDLAGRPAVRRGGARAGDAVVLAGRLGWSAAGLRLLRDGRREGPLVDAHRRPTPPYDAGPHIAAAGATAMCDVSDGLVADAGHLARASGVVVALDAGRLGDEAVEEDDVLHGGEDHALLATLPPGVALPPGWRCIGRVSAGRPAVLLDGRPVEPRGWEHFA